MHACVDVDYREDRARAACVLFTTWSDTSAASEYTRELDVPADYQPGALFLRELPCIRAVLAAAGELSTVVVDGYAWLDAGRERPGLGAHLWRALGESLPVIGVAKNPFCGAAPIELLRGESSKPLYITAAGADPAWASERIAEMGGPYRMPTLLRRVDQLSRDWADR